MFRRHHYFTITRNFDGPRGNFPNFYCALLRKYQPRILNAHIICIRVAYELYSRASEECYSGLCYGRAVSLVIHRVKKTEKKNMEIDTIIFCCKQIAQMIVARKRSRFQSGIFQCLVVVVIFVYSRQTIMLTGTRTCIQEERSSLSIVDCRLFTCIQYCVSIFSNISSLSTFTDSHRNSSGKRCF